MPVMASLTTAFSQSMEGGWILIKSSRIDGSEIVSRHPFKGYYKFVIEKNKVMTVDTPGHHLIKRMSIPITGVSGSIARSEMGTFELMSDSILVYTQKHLPNELDKKNQFVMFREERFYQYLRDMKEIQYENDTTIISNDLIFPFYKSLYFTSLTHELFDALKPVNGMVSGYFILDRQATMADIVIETNKNFEKVDKLIKLLRKTDGRWEVPVKGFAFKTYFTIASVNNGSSLDISYRRNDFNRFLIEEKHEPFSAEQSRLFHDMYNRGVSLAEKKQFEKAIEKFTYCIGVDSLDTDVFYNRALCYYQLNRVKEACLDWKYLKDLGQVTAEKLYNENCKQ
jgi:tetratricopeptide (TPR) repeat protein